MKEKLNEIKIAALEKLNQVSDLQALESLRVEILGKKGELTQILKGMGSLSKEERPVIGQLANEVRSEIEAKLETVKTAFEEKAQKEKLKAETIDVTMPGNTHTLGHRHRLLIISKTYLLVWVTKLLKDQKLKMLIIISKL